MLKKRIVAASAILIAMVSAAAAQSDTSEAPGKPVSLLQVLLNPNGNADKAAAAAATDPEPTTATPDATAHVRTAHRHWHHRRYVAKKSHPSHDEDSAAATPAPQGDAGLKSVAPPADASTAANSPTLTPIDTTAAAPVSGSPTDASDPSAMVVGGQTVQISSENEVNALDLAADNPPATTPGKGDYQQATPTPDPANATGMTAASMTAANMTAASLTAATNPAVASDPTATENPAAAVNPFVADNMPAADNAPAADSKPEPVLGEARPADTQVVAFAQRDDSNDHGRDVWYEDVLAVLGSILIAALVAWFMIGAAPPQRGRNPRMLSFEPEPMRK